MMDIESESNRILDVLNPRQREAVQITEGPLMVIAGAGSGKTKMLTSRIAYLIATRRAMPYQVLAVTFTNKAAHEMKERVSRTLNETAGASLPFGYAPEIGTFHSVCIRLLRRELTYTPFQQSFSIYDDSDQLSLIKTVLDKLKIDPKIFSAKSFQAAINSLKCDAVEPHELEPESHDQFGQKLRLVYTQYQRDLFANQALDFGEILCLTYRVLRDFPEVRKKYQDRYRYIHVDEYQDTNRAQYLILNLLAAKVHGGHQNMCVVGDEDQSIYKWRGADIRNILDFERDYPGAQQVKLEQNYRSTKTIVTAASQLISNNRERRAKTLWTENESGDPIVRVSVADERAEAEFVVDEVKKIAARDGRTLDEFAVFYRTRAQSRSFEDVLLRQRMDYDLVGDLSFYDRKEIKDVLSYLRVVLNPRDSISLKRIINVPARGIGKTTLDKLDQYLVDQAIEALKASDASGVAEQTLWELLGSQELSSVVANAAHKKLVAFRDLLERFKTSQPKLLLSEFMPLILDETGYVRELRMEGTEEADGRIENLEEFQNVIFEFERDFFDAIPEAEQESRRPELLTAFLEQVSLASDVATDDRRKAAQAGRKGVQLMTLHSSKGLEFPVVFMVGLEENLFPSNRSHDEISDEDVEEERRLCYVGMTRAREHLYVTHAQIRRRWGDVSSQDPSRFLNEIPEQFIEMKELSYGAGLGQYRLGSARTFGYTQASGSATSSVDLDHAQAPQKGSRVGVVIDHPDYGEGRIVAEDGAGTDARVTIEFKNRLQRKFLFRFVESYQISD